MSISIFTVALYFQDLSLILYDAFYSEQHFHLLAVLPLFAYLLFRKRKMIQAAVTQESLFRWQKNLQVIMGALVCIISLLFYWFGSYTFTPVEYHMVTLPFFVSGLVLVLFNFAVLKQLIFPIGFLFFLTPPPIELQYSVGSLLSNVSSEISNALANLLGATSTLIYEYGTPIINITRPDQTIINFTLDVACSGIYSLIGYAIFATFIAYIYRRDLKSKVSILLIGIPLIIFLNTLRITIILLIGYHFGNEIALQVFHVFGATVLMFLGTLILLFLMEKYSKKTKKSTLCLQKAKHNTIIQNTCPDCGKIIKFQAIKPKKEDLIKIGIIAFIVGVLLFIQTPVFALTKGPAQVLIQTPTGEKGNLQILPDIKDYELNYLYRDTYFEEVSGQEASLAYIYVPIDPARQAVWVAVEISSVRSYLHRWESCLITWPLQEGLQPKVTQLDLRDIQTLADPPITARFFAFQRHKTNQTQVVLYWYETSTFTTNQTTQIKHVKMSLTAYPTSNQTLSQVEEELLPIANEINNYWQPLKNWGILALVISQNGLNLGLGFCILLIILILYYQYQDRKEKNVLVSVYQKFQDLAPKQFLRAIYQINLNQTPATAKRIANKFRLLSNTKITSQEVDNYLAYFEKLGLIKKQIMNHNDQPRQQWISLIPTKVFKPKT